MDELELVIRKRNARFRAWQGLGMPLEGAFWRDTRGADPDAPIGILEILCRACGLISHDGTFFAREESLREAEQLALEVPEHFSPVKECCDHLRPLLGEDPPEVLALWDLELLAHG